MSKELTGILCVWPATIVDECDYDDFSQQVNEHVGCNKLSKVTPLGGFENSLGLTDFYFTIEGDIGIFILNRLSTGIKWYDDYKDANEQLVYYVGDEKISIDEIFRYLGGE